MPPSKPFPLPPAYWGFIIARRFVVGLPCLYLYLESQGLDSFDVGCCLSAMAGAQLLWEVPSGVASDRLGRKMTLVVAAAARLIAWLCIGMSGSVGGFVFGFFMLGAATAFESGTDSAFLFDTLRDRKESHMYGNLEARSYQLGLFSMGCSTLLGGFLVIFGFNIPIIATIPPMILYLCSTLLLKEPPFTKARTAADFFSQLQVGLQQIISHRALSASMGVAISVIAGCEVYFRFVQQYVTGSLGIEATSLGYIYFLWCIISAAASRFGQYPVLQSRPFVTIVTCALLCGSSLIFLGAAPLPTAIILCATVIPQSAYGIVPTVFRSELNRELPSTVRATVLSIFGFGSSSLVIIGGLLCGWIGATYSRGAALVSEGIAIIIIAIIGVWINQRREQQ